VDRTFGTSRNADNDGADNGKPENVYIVCGFYMLKMNAKKKNMHEQKSFYEHIKIIYCSS